MLQDKFSRRDFLKTSSALIVTFSVASPVAGAAMKTSAAPKTVALDQVDGFLAIDSTGKVTVFSGKVDLGTGIYTALTQIAAEELSVPMDKVEMIQGDTLLTPDQGPTYGSLSIQVGGMQLRQAAATAREALLGRAAEKLGMAKDKLDAKDGQIMPLGGGTSISYGQLVDGQRFEMKVDAKAPAKNPASYTIVGTSVSRLDIPGKVTGKFTYMQDFKRRGMLHARVVRPAAIKATLLSVDDSEAKRIPGFVQTVRKDNFLAVVAKNEWAAIRAAGAVKAQWSDWQGLPDKAKLWEHVRNTKINKDEEQQKTGDAAQALRTGSRTLSATYDFAIHTHGSLGPSCAVAEFTGGKLTCWTASQATHLLRKQMANMLQMAEADVRCIYLEGSGCYGRNGHEDAAADAALLARELGRPVRVQWSREDEHGWDPKGPPTLVDITGGVDASGTIVAWQSEFWIPKATITEGPPMIASTLAGLPTKDILNPGNVFQNSAPGYTLANARAVCHRLDTTPFRPSWIRTPGRMQNTYANETFMDELAAAAGMDPIEFRLKHMKDARGIQVLKAAADAAKWDRRPSPRKDAAKYGVARGRGVSYLKYENVRTYVAAVAEVEVDRARGAVRCTKFTVSHDCGQIINPEGVKTQIEGNVIQTVSRTLKEELKWNRSRVTSVDWVSYPILRFPEVPEVVMELINRPGEPPWGVGEPAACLPPPAISNAIFDAVGVRVRSVPFTPEKVRAGVRVRL